MRVLGIDPGLATVGLGLASGTIHDLHAEDWLVIRTKPRVPMAERLLEIYTDLRTYLLRTTPELVVVEQLFFGKNETTGMDVSQARGCILLAVAEAGLPLLETTPVQMKSAITGDGRADKRQVQQMLLHMFKLQEIPSPDDAADALALAAYGILANGSLNP